MTFYHVTHRKNLQGIMDRGVRPDMSKGARPHSWYVKRRDVAWAFLHCARRHGWRVRDLVAVEIDFPVMEMGRHSNTGLYFTGRVYGPATENSFLTYEELVDEFPRDSQ